ncbi:MAG: tetratricopeptide repeat protein [Opitutaceae bacterium]|nr:tetratricopeptide repeat protein [Cytophagales bacterium]
MLKYLLITFFTLCFISLSNAQTKSTISPKDTATYRMERDVYFNALKYSDLNVAKGAIFKMMAINPLDKSLKDSLLFIYFNAGSFGQCILLSRELLAENPSRNNILEIKAIAEQNLGLVKDALVSYEKLFSESKNLFHQYQIAVLQYQLKRYGECNQNISDIIKDDKSLSEKVNINTGQENQKVILKAAAYNIRGVMQLEGKRDEEAKADFKEALKIQPDFALALNNIQLVEKKVKPSPAKPSVKK